MTQIENAHAAVLLPIKRADGDTVAHALVDADRLDELAQYTWRLHPHGYAYRTERPRRKVYLAHEVVGTSGAHTPRIIFSNGNTLDCRRSNLRPSRAWVDRVRGRRSSLTAEEHTLLESFEAAA